MRLRGTLLLLGLSSCLDTSLPGAPGPGSLSGTVVRAVPGWSTPLPASGAKVEVLGTSLRTTADNDGRFVLDGFTRSGGQLRVAHDANGDGVFDAQRVIPLEPLKVGPGHSIALGQVVLGKSSRLSGLVRLRAFEHEASGHGGTVVFIKGTTSLAFSADTGDFVLSDLPEGDLELVFFRRGYVPVVVPVSLTSGEERRLTNVLLDVSGDTRPAEATGVVQNSTVELPGAAVTLVGQTSRTVVKTDASGSWKASELEPGVYNLGFEADGHLGAVLNGVLLAPGPQRVETVTLREGPTEPVVVNAPPGLPDSSDLCGGACGPGFHCTDRATCETDACALVSCPGVCNGGRCFVTDCSGQVCPPGDVCDDGACVQLECAGVACPSLSACAAGRCVSTLCARGPCPSGEVCANGVCVEKKCVDVACGTGVCIQGQCVAQGTCAPGAGMVNGACVDLRCDGVQCEAGSFCRAGECVASGLYAAAAIYVNGDTATVPEGRVYASTSTGWKRVSTTLLPRISKLLLSRDGQWLLARTDDAPGWYDQGSIWRSSDNGQTWVQSYVGSDADGWVSEMAVDHRTGRMFAVINGNPAGSHGVLVTDNDGQSWTVLWQGPLINGVIRDTVVGVSPDYAVIPFSNYGGSGIYPLDGGAKIPFYQPDGTRVLLVSDPLGVGPTYVAYDHLESLDGGVLGSVHLANTANVLYGDGVHLGAANSIWYSADGWSGWGLRATPVNTPLQLTGLMRASDGRFYAGNEASGGVPLLVSEDDGVTWSPSAEDWKRDLTLSDTYAAWQPDAAYNYQQRVRPTVPNGFVYARGPYNTYSGPAEPQWLTDGGPTVDRDITWELVGPVSARVSAVISRSCGVGQQLCGGACVNLASDPANCGECANVCTGACRFGRCETSTTGPATGCADGTREGFVDEGAWADLAACAGTWSGLITELDADALCGAGFHVCNALDSELRQVDYAEATSFPGCFAYRASNDGLDGCDALDCGTDSAHDDMAALGRGCRLISGVGYPARGQGTSCLADGSRLDAQCCAETVAGRACRQRGESGVVCCRD